MSRTKTDTDKKNCTRCGKKRAPTKHNWYYSNSPLFINDGLFPVCKDCINELVNNSDIDNVLWMLRMMDRPWIKFLWERSESQAKEQGWTHWSMYMKNLAMPQYASMTWKDSEGEVKDSIKFTSINNNTQEQINTESLNQQTELTEEDMKYLVEFWGKGFTTEEYEYLQNEYEKFLSSYECDSYAMELLFQEAAHQRLTIKKLREKGNSVDKELKTLQDLLGSANVKPVQETGANATEQLGFGVLIKKYENERPIPKPDKEWEDVDGIAKYSRVWFLGHLCRMLGIKNPYQDEYDEEINQFKVDAPEYEEGDE